MQQAAENEQYELAARLRDQVTTVHQMQDKQRIATAENEDADVFGFHYENDMLAVNLFHMRSGKIVDRRDFFWEDLPEFAAFAVEEDASETLIAETLETASPEATAAVTEVSFRAERSGAEESPHLATADPAEDVSPDDPTLEPNPTTPAPEIRDDSSYAEEHSPITDPAPELNTNHQPPTTAFSPVAFFSALLKQLYLDQGYVPRSILVPVDFPDRSTLAELLAERTSHRVEILVPQRGEKRSLVDLVCQNAKQSYDQRFRVLIPSQKAIAQALQDALTLEELPRRIECFDISHIQGSETVASMVVWEDGAMKKSDYRKFQVKTVTGVDDFASMREIVQRRYSRLLADKKPFPSLILIDGGLGQLHAAADALNELGITTQPLASIAKREEIIYVYGQEDDPIVLDRRSPVLHLVQKIRDESHRFAITYHRKRREMRDRSSELLDIPGVGPRTRQRLLEHFGSIRGVRQATPDALTAVVNKATADRIRQHFAAEDTPAKPTLTVLN
jgi:excinuclease ABC subunit C